MTAVQTTPILRPSLVADGHPGSRTLVPGHLAVVLTLEVAPGRERPVTPLDLSVWRTSVEELLASAVETLRDESPAADWQPVHTVPGMRLLVSGDGRSASRMLIMDHLFPNLPLGGVLATVPSPDQLLCVPLETLESLEAIEVLAAATRFAFGASRAPLSDQVFWFDGARWHVIAVVHQEDQVEIHPPPGFLLRMGQLAAVDLAGQAAEA